MSGKATWRNVFESVKHAVYWGVAHQDLDQIEAIGVDEIQWQRGQSYLTLVYQIEDGMKRLLWVAQERTEDSLRRFFMTLSEEARLSIRFVCSDMWKPYLNVIAEQVKQAVHVLDRFHIMKKMNEALDEVRRGEAARLKRDGYEPVLKHSRWCLLKRPENRTEKETVKLSELLSTTSKAFVVICCGKTFRGSGSTPARPGPQSSSINGVPAPCGARSSR